jgi:hypothetical protein
VAALFVALIHHPVLDRNGRVVTSAITSLDLHDIARASHTYGVQAFFVVHPVAEQRDFAGRVLDHWRLGYGREYDSRRREALDLIEVVAAERACGQRPLLVYTSARASGGTSYESLRARIEAGESTAFLLMFGTGFGLAPALLERADLRLAPIQGPGEYNHLSVRAAAGIILDRLRGRRL